MRELDLVEIDNVSGGNDDQISGYTGAAAVLTVLGAGALAISLAPALGAIGGITVAISLGTAGGLAVAQFIADISC